MQTYYILFIYSCSNPANWLIPCQKYKNTNLFTIILKEKSKLNTLHIWMSQDKLIYFTDKHKKYNMLERNKTRN